jgi:hypothetical protein
MHFPAKRRHAHRGAAHKNGNRDASLEILMGRHHLSPEQSGALAVCGPARRGQVPVLDRSPRKHDWSDRLRLTRLQPRPLHPKKDPAAELAFKQDFTRLVKAALLVTTAATPLEIWFQPVYIADERFRSMEAAHTFRLAGPESSSRPTGRRRLDPVGNMLS